MSLFSEPRDVTAHLQRRALDLGATGYDHQTTGGSAWQRERDAALMAAAERDPGLRTPSRPRGRLAAALRAAWRALAPA
jgi:hypothetical protein